MNPKIGSYNAKTKPPELLPAKDVGQGDRQSAIAAMQAFPRIKGVPEKDIQSWIISRA